MERADLDHTEVDQHEDKDPAAQPAVSSPSALAAPARAGGDERDNLLEGNGGSDGVGDRDADEEDDLEGGEEPEAPVGVEKVGKGKAEREEKGLSFGFGFAVLSKNSKEKNGLKKRTTSPQRRTLSDPGTGPSG